MEMEHVLDLEIARVHRHQPLRSFDGNSLIDDQIGLGRRTGAPDATGCWQRPRSDRGNGEVNQLHDPRTRFFLESKENPQLVIIIVVRRKIEVESALTPLPGRGRETIKAIRDIQSSGRGGVRLQRTRSSESIDPITGSSNAHRGMSPGIELKDRVGQARGERESDLEAASFVVSGAKARFRPMH